MKGKGLNAQGKYLVIKYVEQNQNVQKACELFEISRTTYYKWLNLYKTYGMSGLENQPKKMPKMPHRVSKSVEAEILAYVRIAPKDGPRQIYYEMKSQGIEIGETGIFNVLKRHGLTQRSKRQAYAFRYKVDRETKKKEWTLNLSEDHIFPGYAIVMGIQQISMAASREKLYAFTVFDLASGWGSVKLFNNKSEIDIWRPFETRFMYLARTFKIDVRHLIIVKEKTYLPFFLSGDTLKTVSKQLGCDVTFISPDSGKVYEKYNAFFSRVKSKVLHFIERDYEFEIIEKQLLADLRQYNFFKEIDNGYYKGMTPGEVVLREAVKNKVDIDTLPIWMNALIERTKREKKDET